MLAGKDLHKETDQLGRRIPIYNFDLTGRTACVTGAAQGLGAAIAEALHQAGCTVVLADVDESVQARAREIDPGGNRVSALPLDMADTSAVIRCFQSASEENGGFDILVNNAALTVMRPIWEIDPAEWDQVMAVNLRGLFFACQAAGVVMRGRGWGRIINLTSLAGQQPSAVAGAHYAASKAAIISVTKNFAQALAGDGVTVNAISPAAVHTPVMEALGEERITKLSAMIPVGRVGRAEEVAAVAVYLASDASSYMTGATLDINGGRYMR